MKVLILGADGFIGRHIAFHLRAKGHEVVAHARRTGRLAEMGFQTLAADLTDPACHDPAFWRVRVAGHHLINAAGLLTGSEAAFEAVHVRAPQAVLAALDPGARVVHLSAVGIDAADTAFARWRRLGEAVFHGQTILRPGLVMADTSYGGTSMLRALAALPLVTPVVGSGKQPFNPIHATDLAEVVLACLETPPPPGTHEIGGPEMLDQRQLVAGLRRWMGLAPAPAPGLPLWLAKGMGRLGDALRLGPLSATAVQQLEAGVLADSRGLLAHLPCRPRGFSDFAMARPAGTQDLWQARLYLLKPLIRLVLACLWLASAGFGLLAPAERFLPLFPGLPETLVLSLARLGGLADLALGLALLGNWRPKGTALAQLAIVLGYTVGLSLLAPALWLDPFGSLLKNLPVLALILVHLALIEER